MILEWTHPERTRRLHIFRHENGLFSFVEEVFVVEEEWPGDVMEYWRPNTLEGNWKSGLYPSPVDAQNDAAKQLPWFGKLLDDIAGSQGALGSS